MSKPTHLTHPGSILRDEFFESLGITNWPLPRRPVFRRAA